VQFDWEILSKTRIEKPFFIAGIGTDDAGKVLSFSHPDFFGIELGAAFEKEPGVKDMGAILGFRRVVRG
jgi:phosphoribosylanthranilate isomerase